MAKDEHPHASIDWASAEVKGGDLTVDLAGEPSADWAKRVEAIVERLDRPANAWGVVHVSETAVTVAAVISGAEEDLHHLLEGAVQQANADFATADEGGDERSGADGAMTEAFRAFADATPADDRPD